MKDFFDYMFASYWGGVIFILLGWFFIRYTLKNPDTNENKWLAGDLSGWAGGISFILIGVTIIIAKLVGKL